jgi:hypothetical protein
MIKGTHTSLTYKVQPYRYLNSWLRAEVYEPYMRKKRFFGLMPARLAYRYVYDTGPQGEIMVNSGGVTPDQYLRVANRAVVLYEEYKLAWEAHGSKVSEL